ncbi:hypothetical protein [Streptomyces sp. CT34]|uniref:hypothetical protein n=1 Tax=Streptomyces sp. CT34 TaxID=1553907 RepID=UPI0005BB983E|nr:hypothetical protein [Streptomyces sp. CT34]
MSRRGIADLDDDDLEEGVGTSNFPEQGTSREDLPAVPEPVEVAQGRPRPALTLADLPEPEETDAVGPLSAEEEDLLHLCMRGIEQFQNAWWVMAKSLANINARRLYRKTHANFEDFCWDNFKKSRPTAYEEMTAYAMGELLSARADKPFDENSNEVSARADTPAIGKKVASAYNPITKDYGAEVSVAVHETIEDATGKKVPVKEIKGIIQQLPRKKEKELTQEELTALARELATAQGGNGSGSQQGKKEQEAASAATPALDALRAAVDELESAHRALAPTKIKKALEENSDKAVAILNDAKSAADKANKRVEAFLPK